MHRILKTAVFFLSVLCANTPHSYSGGNAGGNGGESYTDEFKAYRDWIVETLVAEKTVFQKKFKYDDASYKKALERIKNIKLVRKDRANTLVKIQTEAGLVERKYTELLPADLDELFVIDGEKKGALNITVQGVDLIIVDVAAWNELEGKFDRKMQHIGHEIFGILGLEKTGESTFSDAFFKENAVLRSGPEKIASEPIWGRRFEHEWEVDTSENCEGARYQANISATIGKLCKEKLPTERPSPFFSYECLLSGNITSRIERTTETRDIIIRGVIPGVVRSHMNESWYSYYYRSSDVLRRIHEHSYHRWIEVEPDRPFVRTEHIETPKFNKFCSVKGNILLNGVDPIQQGPNAPVLLKSSKGSWEEAFSGTLKDPEGDLLNSCFEYRKQIRRDFFDKSRCRVFAVDGKTWRWELWAVHPYQSSYPWQDVRADDPNTP